MAESEFEKTYLQDTSTRMAAHVGEPIHDGHPVDDVERNAIPGEPPVPGAQWDEVHRRWEHWDEDVQEWVALPGALDDGVAPADENPLPASLARELVHDDDLQQAHEHIVDAERAAEPVAGPPGAQWNEVAARWERWDEASGEWVEAT